MSDCENSMFQQVSAQYSQLKAPAQIRATGAMVQEPRDVASGVAACKVPGVMMEVARCTGYKCVLAITCRALHKAWSGGEVARGVFSLQHDNQTHPN